MMRFIARFIARLWSLKENKYVIIFVLNFILLVLLTKFDVQSSSDASRIATVKSLVEYHTFTIDNSVFEDRSRLFTVDKYFYNNHYYSDKPPLPAIMGAAVCFLLKYILGIDFLNNFELTCYLMTLFTVGVCCCIALVYFHKILLQIFDIDKNWANMTTFLAASATLFLPYSVVLNNHSLAAAFIIVSFYYCLNFNKSRDMISVILCGLFISMSGSIDITCFLFVPFYLVFIASKSLKMAGLFLLSCIPLIISYLGLNIYLSGSMVPPAMNPGLWDYPGSIFSKQNLSGVAKHKNFLVSLRYAFTLYLGNRGLFSHAPIMLFSAMGIWVFLRQKHISYKMPYLYGITASIIFMLLYTLRTVDYGGYSYGVRWFVAPMLILCLPISHIGNQVRNSRFLKKVFVVIAYISIAISLVGTYNPYPNDTTGKVMLSGGYVSGYTFLINVNNIVNHSSVMYKLTFIVSGVAIYFMFNRLLKKLKDTQSIQPDDNVM